ncbi:hypothetical protein P7K49_003110 [Saguinus oedipus]|uniref:Uncharacterized protein n=1 Tax=Saguinus oedipus TaxID=9490 RepID=A0ABQ9WJ94_SAGOE|nr:hypothetical protein P7K49_003110 [Saguinus oedipus]
MTGRNANEYAQNLQRWTHYHFPLRPGSMESSKRLRNEEKHQLLVVTGSSSPKPSSTEQLRVRLPSLQLLAQSLGLSSPEAQRKEISPHPKVICCSCPDFSGPGTLGNEGHSHMKTHPTEY